LSGLITAIRMQETLVKSQIDVQVQG
jgi:hypothetical protein